MGYYKLANYQGALEALQTATTLDPKAFAAYVTLAGVEYDGFNDITKGCEYASKAVELNANYSWAHNSLAICYQLQQDYTKAEAEFKEAIRLEPENTVFRTNLTRNHK